MTQTAVSWLMEKLKFIDKNAYGILYNESLEQAKAMEKEQMFKFFIAGQLSMEEGGKDFQQYYNKTYNK